MATGEIRRFGIRLLSLLPVTIERVGNLPEKPLREQVRNFSVIFSCGAHYTVELPKLEFAQCLDSLGLSSNRFYGVSNRALWRSSSFEGIKKQIFEQLRGRCEELSDIDAKAALLLINSLRPGSLTLPIETEELSITPNDSVVGRAEGLIYTFAQGSCVVLGVQTDKAFYLAHYQKHLIGQMLSVVKKVLESGSETGKAFYIVADYPADVVEKIREEWPQVVRIFQHTKKFKSDGNYNLKVVVDGATLASFYRSTVHPDSFYEQPFRRFGYEMVWPFEVDPVLFEEVS